MGEQAAEENVWTEGRESGRRLAKIAERVLVKPRRIRCLRHVERMDGKRMAVLARRASLNRQLLRCEHRWK